MNISQYTQIIAVVIVFAIYIYGLFKTIKSTRGTLPNKWNIVIGFTFATLICIYLILNVYRIEPAGFAQIILTFGLVLATALYAISATKQADASVKMAEEMKEQRLAMYKPHIILEKRGGTRGKYFTKEIGIGSRNDRGGAAINVEFYIFHPVFKFDAFRYPSPISVQDNPHTHDFHVTQPSVDDDPGVPIDPVALVVANYEDVSENRWHSTLELIWDATTKDVTPGRTQVALSGHHNIGDSSA